MTLNLLSFLLVSILIITELHLEVHIANLQTVHYSSFNPYYHGTTSRSRAVCTAQRAGEKFQSLLSRNYISKGPPLLQRVLLLLVSILIITELHLEESARFAPVKNLPGFNPYYHGTTSRRVGINNNCISAYLFQSLLSRNYISKSRYQ